MKSCIHNTPKEFESGVLFLQLGLLFTVIVPSQKPSFWKMLFKLEESRVAGRAILKPGNRNPESGIRNPEPETRNPKPETRNPEPGTRNPESEIRNPEPGIRIPDSRFQGCPRRPGDLSLDLKTVENKALQNRCLHHHYDRPLCMPERCSKHKSKLTGDCCVVKLLQHNVDGS